MTKVVKISAGCSQHHYNNKFITTTEFIMLWDCKEVIFDCSQKIGNNMLSERRKQKLCTHSICDITNLHFRYHLN